jgi:UDPglucose 6-dehydrogenase
MKIGFYGLSHLGLTYLSATSYKGFNTVGCDEISILEKIKSNNYVKEPNVFEIIKRNKKSIFFSENIQDLNTCNIIFFSFDTPIQPDGKSKDVFIKNKLIKLLKILDKNKILVILSQVKPGFLDKIKWNNNSLFYMVETLIFGNALRRAINPERIIIGTKYKNKNLRILIKFLKKFTKKIVITNYISAEFTKICINIFLISSIFTSNYLSSISKIIGANWTDICRCLKLDKRIGKHAYLRPSIGLSGTNLLRDLKIVSDLAKKKSLPSELSDYWLKKSLDQSWTIREFKRIVKNSKKYNCLVLGLSYKENTNSILNSASISFLKTAESLDNCKFSCYDPSVKKFKSKNSRIIKNINFFKFKKNFKNILFIMTPWQQFFNIKFAFVKKFDFIFDPYAIISLNKSKYKNYISLY